MYWIRISSMLKALRQVRVWLMLFVILVVASISGCGIVPEHLTLGPTTERDILFVHYKGVAARVCSKTTAEVEIEQNGKVFTRKLRLDGFYVISPDMKDDGQPVMKKAEAGSSTLLGKGEATPAK